ncbi:MAG: ABC transporter ATP-binding protein [Chitinispirillaceae bacterium]|nr:ABC transporter ATP-binding protein [Chitinispirillaceae bacterium]
MNSENTAAIEALDVAKHFGQVEAVKGVSFCVNAGEIFGFLGPNGAGKTTTINMLTGLARPDHGRISYFGRDYTANLKKAQHLMGVVPDESNLYPEMSGLDNLSFCASLYGMGKKERETRSRELLASFGLTDASKRAFGGYSRGMKRRLTIAAGIIHHPKILFLDEPTTGVDVASARRIRELIAGLKSSGTTVFLTTHYIEEAQRLCDRIAFIVDGRIVRMDAVAELLRQTHGKHVVELTTSGSLTQMREEVLRGFSNVEFEFPADNILRSITEQALALAPLIRFLEERGIAVTEARAVKPSLEDVFIRVTGIEVDRMKKEKEKKGPQ